MLIALLAATQISASWLSVQLDLLSEQSDWCNNMPIHFRDQFFLVNMSRLYFSTRLQGTHETFGLGTKPVENKIISTVVFSALLCHAIIYMYFMHMTWVVDGYPDTSYHLHSMEHRYSETLCKLTQGM